MNKKKYFLIFFLFIFSLNLIFSGFLLLSDSTTYQAGLVLFSVFLSSSSLIGMIFLKFFYQSMNQLEHQWAVAEKQLKNTADEKCHDKTLLQEQIKETEAVKQELEQFVYVTSHDLKAPLRAIDNLSQWIEEDLEEHLNDETRYNMRLLRNRVLKMEGLLDDLLRYSRVGRKKYPIEAVEVKTLIEDLIEVSSPPKTFTFHLSSRLPKIYSEKPPLEQVFLHLIENAVKHHDQEKGEIFIDFKDMGAFYEFLISDDGPGIPQEYSQKVFEVFQSLNPQEGHSGSGMGLALVKKIVQNSGGSIALQKKDGKGTTFAFTWPKEAEVVPSQQN